MWAPRRIELKWKYLETCRDAILRVQDFSLADIKKIWMQAGDLNIVDLNSITAENYDYQHPVYIKMIHRFNNCQKQPAVFYHQIDCFNQRLMRIYCGFNTVTDSLNHEILDFLAWISNMKGSYDIASLSDVKKADLPDGHYESCEAVKAWRASAIDYFFNFLQQAQRDQLMTDYNLTCVRAYNDYQQEQMDKKFQLVTSLRPEKKSDELDLIFGMFKADLEREMHEVAREIRSHLVELHASEAIGQKKPPSENAPGDKITVAIKEPYDYQLQSAEIITTRYAQMGIIAQVLPDDPPVLLKENSEQL